MTLEEIMKTKEAKHILKYYRELSDDQFDMLIFLISQEIKRREELEND